MYRTFFVFLKCTIQGGPKVDVLLIAFLYLWLKVWEGIDKYRIVPVRKLFYFHHWLWLKLNNMLTPHKTLPWPYTFYKVENILVQCSQKMI